MAEPSKHIWESKTFWLALLQIVIGILTAINSEMLLGSSITLIGFIQIVLRAVTTTAVKLPFQSE